MIEVYCAHDKMVDIEKITGNPRNPNQHPDSQIELLAKIIKAQGWRAPITVSTRSGFVVRGHGRLMAAHKLGLLEVPVDYQDYESEAAEYADLIADNRLSELSSPDNDLIRDLLSDLDNEAFDLELAGFTAKDFSEILATAPADIEEDDFDPAEEAGKIKDPVTKPGDVWHLGRHRLLCGDATVLSDVERLMDGELADMVFTDPPYNVNYEGGTGLKIKNDNMTDDSFYQFLYDSFVPMFTVTKEGGPIYVCHADSEGLNFRKSLKDAGWLFKQCIIWAKSSLVMGRQDYQWKHEPILYGWKPGAAHSWFGGRKKTTVWEDEVGAVVEKKKDHSLITITNGVQSVVLKVPSVEVVFSGDDSATSIWRFEKPLKNADHPTMKPIGIPARAINNSCITSGLVLDCFGGSGSTLMAAEQTGRRCNILELDPVYCDVIVARWEKFTGKKAVLLK